MSAGQGPPPAEPPPDAVPSAATVDLTADVALPQMGWMVQTPRGQQTKGAGEQAAPASLPVPVVEQASPEDPQPAAMLASPEDPQPPQLQQVISTTPAAAPRTPPWTTPSARLATDPVLYAWIRPPKRSGPAVHCETAIPPPVARPDNRIAATTLPPDHPLHTVFPDASCWE